MWYKIRNQQQIELRILVKPNAKKTTLVEISDQELHIALHAKPQKGEANKELIAYLAKLLELPKSKVILHRGETSRHKVVLIPLSNTVQKCLDSINKFVNA